MLSTPATYSWVVDPYTYSNKGAIQITAFQDVDFGARHEESFCYGKKKATQGG